MRKTLPVLFMLLLCMTAFVPPAFAEKVSRPITAWPFVLHSSDEDHAETSVLFGIYHFEREKTRTRYAVRPFIFSTESDPEKNYRKTSVLWPISIYKREEDHTHFHVFPLYWYKSTPEEGYNVFFPLYWSARGEGYTYTHLWPLYSRRERGSYREYGTLYPLIRFGRDPEQDVELDHFLLYYHKRERDRSFTTLFPLYGREVAGPEKKTWLFPLYYSRSDADSLSTFALPVLPYYHHQEPGRDTLHLWPLYSRLERGNYREYGTLYPLVRFGRDPEQDFELDQFLLYYHKRERDRSFTTFFPLYWSKIDGERKQRLLIPLYYHREDTDSLLTLALPVLPYYHHREPGRDTLHLWPLYSRLEQGSYREYGTLYPLIRFGRDPERDVELDQFLLYYHKGEQDRSFTTFFPLYGRKVEGQEKKTWLFPLYYSRSDADSFLTLALPVLPYYHHREPGSDTLHLWPLYSRLERGSYWEHGTLYPLIRFGRDPERDIELDHFLLYHHKREKDRSFTAAFPFYWSKTEGAKKQRWLIPLYYHREDADSLLTLALPVLPYYHRKDREKDTLHLWPLYSRLERGSYREHGALYPLIRFGRDPERDIELDHFLLYYHKREGENSFSTLVPLWFSSRKPNAAWDLVLPIYYGRKTPDETVRFIAPLYYSRETPESSVRTLVPLYFSRRTATEHFNYIFPTYFASTTETTRLRTFIPFYLKYDSPAVHFTGITPLFMKRTTEESAFTTLLPLYFDYDRKDFGFTVGIPVYLRYRSGPFTFTSVFPLYYDTENSERKTGFTYYFPFYGEYRRGEAVSRHFLLFPLYSRFSDEELQLTGWDVLWPLFHYESSPTTRSVRVPPIFWHGSTPENSYTVVLPLYWSFASGDKSYQHLIPFYGVHREGDWYRKSFVFGPLFMDTRNSRIGLSQQDALLWLYSRRVEGEKKLSWLFPLYYHRSDADSLLTFALPVLPYYHSREPEREKLVVFPVYSMSREKTYTEHASFWPLIRFGRDPERDIELDQFLLYYHKREQDRSFTTAFPLYWSKTEGARKQRWLIPLYYHREDADSLLTLALPVLPYYHRKDQEKDTLHLWPLYSRLERGSYREYGTLYPLIRFGRDPERDVELDQFLLYYHKREQGRSFTTFFPLYGRKVEGQEKKTWFIPLYYSQSDADSLLTLALPVLPYYHRKEPGNDTLHLWPLYSRLERGSYREHGTLYPLIRFGRDPERDIELDQFLLYYHKQERDRSFTTAFPFYWSKTAGAKKQRWLIPLYYHREDTDSLLTLALPVLPYYHSKEPERDTLHLWPLYSRLERRSYREHGTLYPLIRFGRDHEQDVELDQFLLYYHKREQGRSFTTFFPLYGRKVEGQEKKTWFIPLYYSQSDADSLLTFALPVLPYYHRKEPGNDTLHLWPLYSRLERGSYREHATLYPLIRFGRDEEQGIELDHFLLYYHKREGAASFSMFFPLWWHQEKDENTRRDATIFFHWYERDELHDETKLSFLWLVPPSISLFRYHREGGTERHGFFPLYSYSFDRERDATNWSILWILFSYSSEGEFAQQTGFLWKVISYERKDAETSDFRFLWRVIRKNRTARSSTFEFNPFYYYESEEGKSSYWAILGGLFGVETTPEMKKRYRLFWIF